MPASLDQRPRLQRNHSPVAVALWATPSPHEWFVMVALRTAKRLQRNLAWRVSNIDNHVCGNPASGLRARRKIFREQTRRLDARDAKRQDHSRALCQWRIGSR